MPRADNRGGTATDANTLVELAARVKAATAEQQAELLNDAFAVVFGPPKRVMDDDGVWLELRVRFDGLLKWRAFESAAMTLVPEGWDWSAGTGRGTGWATLGLKVTDRIGGSSDDEISREASTPALALVAACLRARAAAESAK